MKNVINRKCDDNFKSLPSVFTNFQ